MVSVLGVTPDYKTFRGDYLIIEWTDVGRDGLIKAGLYDEMVDLVNQFEIEPTVLYRGISRVIDHTTYHGTSKGAVIDYTGRLSSWSTEYAVAHYFANGKNSEMYRLVVTHKMIGLKRLHDRSTHEVILPGHLYTVTSDGKEDGWCIDVEITD
jgi:hypothetical protein